MLIFFVIVTLVFVVLAFMFPEWVGITGKKALEVQKHQQTAHSEADIKTDSQN